MTAFQAGIGRIVTPILCATDSIRALMCDKGEPKAEGALFTNPALADVLEVFGIEGARLIQEGEVAAALLQVMEEGGHLTRDDLRRHRAVWREPLRHARGMAEIGLNPPPALGGALIAFALAIAPDRPGAADLARRI